MADAWSFPDWETALGLSSDAVEENIRGTDEVKLTSRLNKTEEEIERLTLDETLGDVERAAHLLQHGIPVQKLCALSQLSRLLAEHCNEMDEIRTSVFGVLVGNLAKEPSGYVVQVGTHLAEVLRTPPVALPGALVAALMPTCRRMIQHRDEAVVGAWAEVLVASIAHLSADVIEQEVLPDVVFSQSLTQPSQFRMFACRVMGAAALRLPAARIELLFLRKALSLCQDTNYEVRRVMCGQLAALATGVGPAAARKEILDEFVELLEDEEAVVREAACLAMTDLLPLLDAESRKVFLPRMKRLVEDKQLLVQLACAKQLGPFMWETREQLSPADLEVFLVAFQQLARQDATDPLARVRVACVHNLPAVIQLAGVEKMSLLKLDELVLHLARDTRRPVRVALGRCLHVCARLLGRLAPKILREPMVALLSQPVRAASSPAGLSMLETASCSSGETISVDPLMENLGETLEALGAAMGDGLPQRKGNPCAELLPALMARHRAYLEGGFRCWRDDYALVEHMPAFRRCFYADDIFDQCIPALLALIHPTTGSPVVPLRKLAVRVLCFYMRVGRRLERREYIWRQMYERLRARSFRDRLLYLDFCHEAMVTCSRAVFKEHFLLCVFELSRDRVANVRLKVCQLLGPIRALLRAPADAPLIQRYNEVVRVLCTLERDRDVVQAASAISRSNLNPESAAARAQHDEANRRREAEEEAAIAAERDDAGDTAGPGASAAAVGASSSNHAKRLLHGSPAPWTGHVPPGGPVGLPLTLGGSGIPGEKGISSAARAAAAAPVAARAAAKAPSATPSTAGSLSSLSSSSSLAGSKRVPAAASPSAGGAYVGSSATSGVSSPKPARKAPAVVSAASKPASRSSLATSQSSLSSGASRRK